MMDESGGSSMAGGSYASETPEFKRLLRHPSVTTPSKVNEAKKQKRREVVESDDEASFVADTQAASGVGGWESSEYKKTQKLEKDNLAPSRLTKKLCIDDSPLIGMLMLQLGGEQKEAINVNQQTPQKELHLRQEEPRGVYTFRVNGQSYHRIGSLLPKEGTQPRNWCHSHASINVELHLLFERTKARQYNKPTVAEVATLITNDFGDGIPSRDIIVNKLHYGPKRISELYPTYIALQYPLLFSYGKDGFHEKIPYYTNRRHRKTNKGFVTMKEYYSYIIHQRNDQDLYHNVCDAVTRGDTNAAGLGQRIVLLRTFVGGPRYMMQNYQDAMALCRTCSNPDLFITFTSNPKWQEISEMLTYIPVQKAHDLPEIGTGVFKMKLTDLLHDLTKNHIFGASEAIVYVIEFQKRGLPHAHILLWLEENSKCKTPAKIDDIILAELPSPTKDPDRYKVVTDYMLHGPCGKDGKYAPCTTEGKCSKHYPKQFYAETVLDEDRMRKLYDYPELQLSIEQIQNYCLVEIQEILNKNGRSLTDFQDLPRGTGKTFFYNTIIARLRTERKIVLAVVSSDSPIEAIMAKTYPNFIERQHDEEYLKEHAILTPRNDDVDEINTYMIKKLTGKFVTYNSADEICKASTESLDQQQLYPTEFLNTLNFSGMPPHALCLKKELPIMLLRNVNPTKGLCNGTRLIITELGEFVIHAKNPYWILCGRQCACTPDHNNIQPIKMAIRFEKKTVSREARLCDDN
ncbi:helicase [Tanacetum coccineum]